MTRPQPRLGYPGAKAKLEEYVSQQEPVKQVTDDLRDLQHRHAEIVKTIQGIESTRRDFQSSLLVAQAEAVLEPTPENIKTRNQREKKDQEFDIELTRQRAALGVLEKRLTAVQKKHQEATFQGLLARGAAIRDEIAMLAERLEAGQFTDRATWDKLVLLYDEYDQLPAVIRVSGYPDYQRPTDEIIYHPSVALAARIQAIILNLTGMDTHSFSREHGRLPQAQLQASRSLKEAFHLKGS